MPRGYAPSKVDANQQEIIAAVRKLGVTVAITSQIGKGFSDTVWGVEGINLLVEIKDGKKTPSKRKLTPSEEEFHNNWRGQIEIVSSIEEAVKLVNKIKMGKYAAQSLSSRVIDR